MKTIHYINLTNGLEYLPELKDKDVRFIRIQSTACEQKRWNFILEDLDNDLLLNLALGNTCIIYDTGRKGITRALWQGVKWVEYVLNRRWFNKEIDCFKGHVNFKPYFHLMYDILYGGAKVKIDYFKKFLLTDKINLQIVFSETKNDGKYEYFKEQLVENYLMENY